MYGFIREAYDEPRLFILVFIKGTVRGYQIYSIDIIKNDKIRKGTLVT